MSNDLTIESAAKLYNEYYHSMEGFTTRCEEIVKAYADTLGLPSLVIQHTQKNSTFVSILYINPNTHVQETIVIPTDRFVSNWVEWLAQEFNAGSFTKKIIPEHGPLTNGPFSKLTYAQSERVAYTSEKCAGVIKVLQKILRHGYEVSGSTDNRDDLERALGALYLAISLLTEAGDVDEKNISIQARIINMHACNWFHHQEDKE